MKWAILEDKMFTLVGVSFLKMPLEKNLRGFYIQHWRKFVVCGQHLTSINFPPRNWEGYYAYSSRMGGKLCLL
jgi:hypothetical protein